MELPTASRWFVGLDLGQVSDFTAMVVLERPMVSANDPPEKRRPPYGLGHIVRFTLGTSYPDIVESVIQLLQKPVLIGCELVVDQTGVGRGVVDIFRDQMTGRVTCRMIPITITGGHAVTTGADGGIRVPKKELVGSLISTLQTRRLHVAKALQYAPVLGKEMENFRIKQNQLGNESFEAWREGDHDDLVLATAMAVWWGEKGLPPRPGVRRRPRGPDRITPTSRTFGATGLHLG